MSYYDMLRAFMQRQGAQNREAEQMPWWREIPMGLDVGGKGDPYFQRRKSQSTWGPQLGGMIGQLIGQMWGPIGSMAGKQAGGGLGLGIEEVTKGDWQHGVYDALVGAPKEHGRDIERMLARFMPKFGGGGGGGLG